MALRLFTSNRLEILADALAEVLRTPLTSPFDKEVIVVQSKGMEHWLSMQLAQNHGICANIGFPFPNAFAHGVFGKFLHDLPEQSPFDPKIMRWKIMRLMPSFLTKPGFEGLRSYLGDNRGDLKALQLSERIADTFDQYLLFRPEMILRWEGGEEDHWQAVLWRELAEGNEKRHRAALGKSLFEAVKKSSFERGDLPERVSVFGISSLPRFHMEVLAALSRIVQINLFLLNPCREYWGDVVSDWEMKRAMVKEPAGDFTTEELHLEKGNSLLASMGTLGRDFFDLVSEFDSDELTSFEDPDGGTLLSCIQSDILNLREPDQEASEKRIVSPDDYSVQIHSCHSPMREIEVLRDRFLEMFEKAPDLMPRDILVMAPDIETYAPYIQAVFDNPPNDSVRIPFTIADQSAIRESEIIDTFLAILDLCGSRFGASQLFSILESPALRLKLGLLDSDLDLVRKWIRDTRIRWGIDEENRGQLGLPPFPENTWSAGLKRLLLGYAMPGEETNMFRDILPYDHIEGSGSSVLGPLIEFVDKIFDYTSSMGEPLSLDEWSETLTALLDTFFMPDQDTERGVQMLRGVLSDLAEMKLLSGFDEKIDINAVRHHLASSLETKGFGFGFMTGGITFCAMLPMRSIPFKVICLVGMDSDAYPRQSKPLGFDLMASHPRPGDRSRRNDDRYLFLETILSAREQLSISYVGQSIQDNTPVPPSVLVSELMDYIGQGFRTPEGSILDHIVTRHRLQAFSPEYFKENEKLFSYSEENCMAAQRLLEEPDPLVPFIYKGLSAPEEKWKRVDLDDLCRFFNNPAKFLLTRRLGLLLGEESPVLEEREAFEIKGLERYLLEKDLLSRRLAGHDLKGFFRLARAEGRLPHGSVGESIYENLRRGVERFLDKTATYIQGTPLEPLEIDLCISDFRLTGKIETIYPDMLLQYRYAKVKCGDRLRLWIHHLALNSLMAEDHPHTSMGVGLNRKRAETEWVAWEYPPVEDGREILGRLLEQYWEGLTRPIHFFPESSWAYAHAVFRKNRPIDDALNIAQRTWIGTDFNRGECEDAYYQRCFVNTDPLDSEFQHITEEVLGPILGHQREIQV